MKFNIIFKQINSKRSLQIYSHTQLLHLHLYTFLETNTLVKSLGKAKMAYRDFSITVNGARIGEEWGANYTSTHSMGFYSRNLQAEVGERWHTPTSSHREAHQGHRAAGLIGLYPAALFLTMKAEHGPTIGYCTLFCPKMLQANIEVWVSYLEVWFHSSRNKGQTVKYMERREMTQDEFSTWPFLRLGKCSIVWVMLRIYKTHISR